MAETRARFVPAHAKINLTLDVLGKRPDGYHELISVMQTISLADVLLVGPLADGEVICETDVPALRSDHNLVLRAARLLATRLEGRALGARLELHKVLPLQGGLGGGSGDAGSTLVALNALWGAGLDEPELEALAAELGSDVPFFIRGGTCLIEGRGERVMPLPDVEPFWLVLAKPPINVPTPAVFRALSPSEWSSGEDTAAVMGAIRRGEPLPFERLSNALEVGVLRTYGAVAGARDTLLAAGAPLVRLSGSGPTLFVPFRTLLDAASVYQKARMRGLMVWLCHTVTRAEVARARLR
jgi:4-diphosphocytidyl-2-C-methyl-D-erythritol kinase